MFGGQASRAEPCWRWRGRRSRDLARCSPAALTGGPNDLDTYLGHCRAAELAVAGIDHVTSACKQRPPIARGCLAQIWAAIYHGSPLYGSVL